jgi:hypothetical protein
MGVREMVGYGALLMAHLLHFAVVLTASINAGCILATTKIMG